MNSKISEWLFSNIGTTTGVGTVRWKKFTIEELIVIPPTDYIFSKVKELFELLKTNHIKHKDYENETNFLINEFYKLDKNEMAFLEKHSKT